MIDVKQMLVPVGSKRRKGTKLKGNNGVTIHEAGTPNAPAKNHALNQYNNCNAAVNGWHFTVDDIEAWQSFPLDEVAEHSGKRFGNDTTVAIEIADKMTTGEYWDKAVDNAAQLAAWVLRQQGFLQAVWRENIWQHNDWNGKDCPYEIRRGNPMAWEDFVALVNRYMGAQGEKPQVFVIDHLLKRRSPTVYDLQVQWVQEAFLRAGGEYITLLGSAGADGRFGSGTEKAVKKYQREVGLQADGIIGHDTAVSLGAAWEG